MGLLGLFGPKLLVYLSPKSHPAIDDRVDRAYQ